MVFFSQYQEQKNMLHTEEKEYRKRGSAFFMQKSGTVLQQCRF